MRALSQRLAPHSQAKPQHGTSQPPGMRSTASSGHRDIQAVAWREGAPSARHTESPSHKRRRPQRARRKMSQYPMMISEIVGLTALTLASAEVNSAVAGTWPRASGDALASGRRNTPTLQP